jgi:hypothetical protein
MGALLVVTIMEGTVMTARSSVAMGMCLVTIGLGSATGAVGPPSNTTNSFAVFTGYADCPAAPPGCMATKIRSPRFPQPWYSQKGVVFAGDPSVSSLTLDQRPDESAVRIDDLGTTTLTISDVSISGCGSSPVDLWGTAPFVYPYTITPGQNLILASTSGDNFDGSEICGAKPIVTVVINGITHRAPDEIANNGRGALVGGPATDESTFWTKIHGASVTLTISPASLPSTTVGSAFRKQLTAKGGDGQYTFAVKSGTLPPGLALSPAGLLSGTATTPGAYPFTVSATDTARFVDRGSQSYDLVVNS